MKSLTELNSFNAATVFEFNDERPPNVILNTDSVFDQQVDIFEGENHISPNSVEVNDIINYDVTNLSYNIDLTNMPDGTSVIWSPSTPAWMNDSVDGDVYSITGFKTPADWEIVKNPTIDIPNDVEGIYNYTASLTYTTATGVETVDWIVTVTITGVDELQDANRFFFTSNTTQTLTGTPAIIDTDSGKTYTITLTPSNTASVTSLSSTGTGGSSSFNGTTKVLTIVGTKNQVNSHLSNVSFTASTVQEDFNITYLLTNSTNGVTDTKIQQFRCLDVLYLGGVRTATLYYTEDTTKAVSGGPLVTDTDYDGSGVYTYTVFPSTTAAVSTMSATTTLTGKTITNAGAVVNSTDTSKFGSASMKFNGLASSYVSIDSPQFNLSNDDFTIEFWVRVPTNTQTGGILNKIGSSVWGGHLGYSIVFNNGKIYFIQGLVTPFNYSPLGAVATVGNTNTISANTWTHIAFSRLNGVLRTYQDGVKITENSTSTFPDSTQALQIGKAYYGDDGFGNNSGQWYDVWNNSNGILNGYLDEIRFSRIARYTGNTFTPATSAFTYDSFTTLLIHSDGANNTTSFTDDIVGADGSGTTSFNSSTKTLTISGSRDAVNRIIDNITLVPATDYAQNFVLNYRVVTPRGASATATKQQNMFISGDDTEIVNMNFSRQYTANNANFLFTSNTPQITDNDVSNPTYTAQLSVSSSLGGWATQRNGNRTQTLTKTGTRSEVNAWFATVVYYPNKGVSSSGTFTYTQFKNGVQQITQSVSLNGNAGNYPVNSYVWGPSTVGTSQWRPTWEEVYYVGRVRILTVGGGGGGGLGGGGGGWVRVSTNVTITQSTYAITVGAGGAAGNYNFSIGNYENGQAGGASSFGGLATAAGGGGGGRAGGSGGSYIGGTGTGGTSGVNSTSRSGGSGYISSTQRRGGGGASPSANGTAASTNGSLGSDRFGGAGGAGYTYDGLVYSPGGTGGFYDQVNGQAVSGSMASATAGAGGAGNIGGAAISNNQGGLKTGLPLATAGQNGRVKIWVEVT